MKRETGDDAYVHSGAAPATVGLTKLFEMPLVLAGKAWTAEDEGKPGDRPDARNLRVSNRIGSRREAGRGLGG